MAFTFLDIHALKEFYSAEDCGVDMASHSSSGTAFSTHPIAKYEVLYYRLFRMPTMS